MGKIPQSIVYQSVISGSQTVRAFISVLSMVMSVRARQKATPVVNVTMEIPLMVEMQLPRLKRLKRPEGISFYHLNMLVNIFTPENSNDSFYLWLSCGSQLITMVRKMSHLTFRV